MNRRPDRIILDIEHLVVEYRIHRKKTVRAVSDVSFQIRKGETLGLVGESGCGKSSIARAVMQLPPPVSGRIIFDGNDLNQISKRCLRKLRPMFQIIFQDSFSALNPRRKVGDSIAMPLKIVKNGNGIDRKRLVLEMMASVGLDSDVYDRRPFELSGGQCQRVQIARALMAKPKLLICDEPVSSLDVSVQAQILNLLEKMRRRHGLTMLFISHDLSVIKTVSDRVAVMHDGKLCETGPTEAVFTTPVHSYTKALLKSAVHPGVMSPKTI